jgi:hypothetical protein
MNVPFHFEAVAFYSAAPCLNEKLIVVVNFCDTLYTVCITVPSLR